MATTIPERLLLEEIRNLLRSGDIALGGGLGTRGYIFDPVASLWVPGESAARGDGASGQGLLAVGLQGLDGGVFDRLLSSFTIQDGDVGQPLGVLKTQASLYASRGDASAWDRVRTALSMSDAGDGVGSLQSAGLRFNDGTWDRERNNTEGTLLASAARTATTNTPNQTNYNGIGLAVFLDITVNPGGGETLQLAIRIVDPASGSSHWIFDSGAQAFGGAAGQYVAMVYPGIAAAAVGIDGTKGFFVPRTWNVQLIHSAASTWNYSVGSALVGV